MQRKIYLLFLCATLLIISSLSASADDTFTSTTADTNAVSLSSDTKSYENITVTKTGDATGTSDGESGYDWTGTNAAILASQTAQLTITGASTDISSDAAGGNAVFCYGGNLDGKNLGNGAAITISDATITTLSNNSGGIMVTGGGTINAANLTVTTSGGSSAAIRSDKGGGNITAAGGTYTTNGAGSPAIYSTAKITGSDVILTANNSQVVVIEGGNSVTLTSADLTANHATLNGQDSSRQAILIYQSQSGDASDGASTFTMTGGRITNTSGDIFHVTNTTTTITLSSVDITNNDSSGYFMNIAQDSWGTTGNNGGKVTFSAVSQDFSGDIIVDSASTLTMSLEESSDFTGAVNTSGQAGKVTVTLEAGTTWKLTADSYIYQLTNYGTIISLDKYKLYANGKLYDGTSTTAGGESTAASITTDKFKDGTVGKNYTATLRSSGTAPITWTASGLPTGLSITTEGKISGKPMTAGSYDVMITATNSEGQESKYLTLKIIDVKPVIKASVKKGAIDVYYSTSFTTSSGTGIITWSLSGDLPSGLSFKSATVTLSGTPKEAWNDYITINAANTWGTVSKKFKLQIKADKPKISTKYIPDAMYEKRYITSFDVSGTKPFTTTLTGLPEGMTYSSDALLISGSPAVGGTYKLKLTVSNPAGKATKSYKLIVYSPPSIIESELSDATAGKSYTHKFKADGTTPMTWSVVSGSLPAGMSIKEKNGQLKGKPTNYGPYEFTVAATNKYGTDSSSVRLTVKAQAPKLSGNFKKGKAGSAYSSTLKAKGTEPLYWSLDGDLPDGFTFNNGTLTGNPDEYFSSNVTVTVSNDGGTVSKTYRLLIAAIPPKITTKTLPEGKQGENYSAKLTATGTPEIKWNWSENPAGLVLDEDTGEISGIPTAFGKFSVKVTAANDAKIAKKTYKITIAMADPAQTTSAMPEVKSSPESEDVYDDAEDTLASEDIISQTTEHYSSVSELPEGYIIAAELGEISVDVSGQYDFSVTLSDDAHTGAKLFWVAGSEQPSDDDAIAEFYDSDWRETSTVPANHEVNISAWLNKGIIYRPVIAVKPL